jgi:predicted dehydrogenase
MTWSLAEGPPIIAAEKRSGKVLQVGSGTKTSTMTAKVKELIAQGAIGKVHQIRMVNHRNTKEGAWVYPIPPDASPETIDWPRFLGPAPKRSFAPEVFFRWRCWWEYSGGVTTDLFVHLLTTLHEFMGVRAPASVVSQGGLYFYKDGRTVPDVMESVFEYPEGFLAQMCVNLKTTAPAPYAVIMGSEGTLVWEARGLTHYSEAPDPDIQSYGSLAWPKSLRDEYLAKRRAEAQASGVTRQRLEPKQVTVERGKGHAALFLESILEGKPSRENATEGHAAAGAGHLANLAYRKGRKMRWDFATNKATPV